MNVPVLHWRDGRNGRVRHGQISLRGQPVSFGALFDGLLADRDDLRTSLGKGLASVPFEAFFFELPPLTNECLGRPAEFVVVDAPMLALPRAPEPEVFGDHLRTSELSATFSNLSGDAVLVAPVPGADLSVGTHLAAFLRGGAPCAQHALWQALGTALRRRLSNRPVWVSTSGTGVHWLHLRLDDRPKYYTYGPYRHTEA